MSIFTRYTNRNVAHSALCLACTALTPMAAYAQAEASEDATDEIIVTATRRDLKVSDIPLSISALAQDTLITRGVRDVRDIAYVAPGLSVTSENDGEEHEVKHVRRLGRDGGDRIGGDDGLHDLHEGRVGGAGSAGSLDPIGGVGAVAFLQCRGFFWRKPFSRLEGVHKTEPDDD